ncbi:MAG: metallophosphoesterase [Candidatus Lokiarchaeia archaeon]|nr:metallophosphoesterase [Candidatus Lokiarchaeia archaeon]
MNSQKERTKDRLNLIHPNLGQPSILKIDRKLKKRKLQASLYFISSESDPQVLREYLSNQISIVPLFDYKWSYRLIFKRKKQGLFSKLKERLFFRKKKKILEEELKSSLEGDLNLEQLKKLKARLHRGDPIYTKIIELENYSVSGIQNASNVEQFSPQEILKKNQVYGILDNYWKVIIEFTLNKEVLKFLKRRNFVMFDINYLDTQINYHSLVVSKQKWKDFTFIHATDLHLAERNDRLYELIKKWTESSIVENVEGFFETVKKKLKLTKKKPNQEKILSQIKIPLRKRLINSNNQFRIFIKLMNRKVLRNELDFIVITGDLVDYTILSKLVAKIDKLNEFNYEDSNWMIFKNIVLNTPLKEKYKGVLRGEELNCPIFTTIGNHDFRPFPYDITWGEMYRKIGLNASEAIALNQLFSASPISAITKSSLAIKGYISEINSSTDFSIKLGNNLFIVLNTGSDSFKNLKDLITGHPSVTGVSVKQIKYLENLINNQIDESTNTYLFLHGPPLNAEGKKYSINLFEKKGSRFIKKKISEFRESLMIKKGEPLSNARIDGVFNVKYGCVSSNWEKLVEFCKNYAILTLSGHTHENREFRLDDPGLKKSSVYDAPPFKLKKIENPAAIYYDKYSEMYDNPEGISQNGPFVVQTPALGLGSYRNPNTAGGYRELVIKDGKLCSFKVKYIER